MDGGEFGTALDGMENGKDYVVLPSLHFVRTRYLQEEQIPNAFSFLTIGIRFFSDDFFLLKNGEKALFIHAADNGISWQFIRKKSRVMDAT